MYLDRFFGRHCGALTFWVLVLGVHSITTAPRVSRNATINLRSSRRNVNTRETSRLDTKSYGISKQRSKPGVKTQEKCGHLSENMLFLDTGLVKTEDKLSKEATDFLLWLDVDPAPSYSLSYPDENFKKIPESVLRAQKRILKLFNNLPLNPISEKQAEQLKQILEEKPMSMPTLNSSLDQRKTSESLQRSGSATLGPLLKRFRRQAEVKEAEETELPRWPGAPQGVLRKYVNESSVKGRVKSMMLQIMYSLHERMGPLEGIAKKYQHLAPYRMAFTFLKLDQLIFEMHSMYTYLTRKRNDKALTMTRALQMYGQLLRRNIDVTYVTEYLMEREPIDRATRIRQALIHKEQDKLMPLKKLYHYVPDSELEDKEVNW